MFQVCLRTGSRPRFEVLLVFLAICTPLAYIWSQQIEFGLLFTSHREVSETSFVHVSSSLTVQSQPESAFVLSSIVGQPPQTRVYDFFVGLAEGAPDGVQRTMLVVNGRFFSFHRNKVLFLLNIFDSLGKYPGPTIEANQWDRLIVNVHNNLPNATSIHWHGLVC